MLRHRMQCFTLVLLVLGSAAALGSPAPIVYTLGAPLSKPCGVDVDEHGRILILDNARRSLMRFDLNGALDKVWPDGEPLQSLGGFAWTGFHVLPDEKVVIAPMLSCSGKW